MDRELNPLSLDYEIDLAVRHHDIPVLITARDVGVRRHLAQHIHDHCCGTGTFVMLHNISESGINPCQLGQATVCIDDVGMCDQRQQAALMRLLDHRAAMVALSWRVIATSDTHLYGLVLEGSFRSDLYYRLSVMHIAIPERACSNGPIRVH